MYSITKSDKIYKAILPIAIPINQKYSGKENRHISPQYKKYKSDIGKLPRQFKPIARQYIKRKFEKNVVCEISIFDKDNRRDIDATVKILFDVLNGKIWEDDSQIWSLMVKQYVDASNPRVEVSAIEELRL